MSGPEKSPKGRVRNKKLSDGRYQLRWYDPDGVRERKRIVNTKATAYELATEIQALRDKGRVWVDPRHRAAGEANLRDVLDEWKTFNGAWTRPTIRSIDSIIGNVFIGWCESDGGLPKPHRLSAQRRLTETHVLRWRDQLAVTERTQKRYLGDVRRFWEFAAFRHPDVAHPPKRLPIRVLDDDDPDEDPEVVPPTWKQMDAFIEAARIEWLRRAAWLARCQGLRISQVLRLRWTDVDVAEGGLQVRRGRGAKGKKTRTVPLAPVLQREMKGWLKIGNKETICGYLPSAPPNTTFSRCWKRSGVPREVWFRHSSHAFRKGVNDGLDGLGIHPQGIADYIGHTYASGGRDEAVLPRVSQKHYLQRRWGRMLEAAEAIPPVRGPYPKPKWTSEVPAFNFG